MDHPPQHPYYQHHHHHPPPPQAHPPYSGHHPMPHDARFREKRVVRSFASSLVMFSYLKWFKYYQSVDQLKDLFQKNAGNIIHEVVIFIFIFWITHWDFKPFLW